MPKAVEVEREQSFNRQAEWTESLTQVPVPQALQDPRAKPQTRDHAVPNSPPTALHGSREQALARGEPGHFTMLPKP